MPFRRQLKLLAEAYASKYAKPPGNLREFEAAASEWPILKQLFDASWSGYVGRPKLRCQKLPPRRSGEINAVDSTTAVRLLTSESWRVRRLAEARLIELGDLATVDSILAAATAALRRGAAYVVGQIARRNPTLQERSVTALILRLRVETEEFVLREVFLACGSTGNPEALDEVVLSIRRLKANADSRAFLEKERRELVRAGVHALSLAGPVGVARLVDMLASDGGWDAWWKLERLGEAAEPSVVAGLRHRVPRVRWCCAALLGKVVGSLRSIPDLERMAQTDRDSYRKDESNSATAVDAIESIRRRFNRA